MDDTSVTLDLDAEVDMTEAPAGMRGAEGLNFVVGRLTGAKASAADHPIPDSKVHRGGRKARERCFG